MFRLLQLWMDAMTCPKVRYKVAESKEVPVDLDSMRECLAEGRWVAKLDNLSVHLKPIRPSHCLRPEADCPACSSGNCDTA